MGFDRAIIETVRQSAVECSQREITRIAAELRNRGHELVVAEVPLGTGRIPDSVEAILASHSLLHAAEGEMFREALAEAAARCELRVLRLTRKDILSEAGNSNRSGIARAAATPSRAGPHPRATVASRPQGGGSRSMGGAGWGRSVTSACLVDAIEHANTCRHQWRTVAPRYPGAPPKCTPHSTSC
jgi:hypothetical protein